MSRKRNKGCGMDEEFNMLENILEEQGEARRFTKEEEEKFREWEKNPIDIETLNSWTDEFIDSRDGKKVILTKEEEDELREKYKEKYGEYPPEPKEGVYFIRNI